MPIFQYRGYRADGSQAVGSLEAEGVSDAILRVKRLGIFPKEVEEHRARGRGQFLRPTDTTLLPYLTRQLSTLLSSGVPLMESLRSLSEEAKGFWKGLLVDVRDKVAGGASLSRAMESYQVVFPDFYLSMVAAGEQSGALDQVLERLADFLEKQAAIRSRILMSMTYPIFMVCVGFVVMSFLFTFVIPKIVKIFEYSRAALPLPTVILIGVSKLFVHYWWVLIGLGIASFLGGQRMRLRNRPFMDRMKLRIPGQMIKSLYFSRFSRILGFLLHGGLPMLKALELSAKSLGNVVLEARILEGAKKVAEGAALSASLEGFPPVLLQLIATGEKSGKLVEVLSKAADSFEEEFNRRAQKALALLEPSMILLMGVAVGFIVLAVLLPMFQLNQLVK